jgi:phosphopantothenoylcysteine decarboxylase/phosphopantothenate--cysteine ligase
VEQKLAGKKILISLGATREKIDPVRFLTNQSSGKMGFALIEAALAQGAQVTAVTTMDLPRRADKVVRVESHEQMQDALRQEFPDHDVLIMVAAVADYKPKAIAAQKIKTQQNLTVEFEQTTDIVAELAAGKKSNQVVVAFSVETENALEKAQDKIKRKNLDLIVVNSPAAFGADEAEVSIVDAEGELTKLTKSSKSLIAKKVLDCLNIPSKIVS